MANRMRPSPRRGACSSNAQQAGAEPFCSFGGSARGPQPRHLPFWQIKFEGFSTPTLYVGQHTGDIVAKRHNYWRLFDWMWRFHIMDYDDGENVSNWFLFLVATMGLLAAFSGAVLTFYRVALPNKNGAV